MLMKKSIKSLSIVVAFCMLASFLPMMGEKAFTVYADGDFTITDGVLTQYNGSGGDVVIPSGVTAIGSGAFSCSYRLTKVTIPSSVKKIGNEAFLNCERLKSITIPDSVTTIAPYAFMNCEAAASLSIGSGVISIGDEAFWGCASLTGVTIPENVTSIGSGIFGDCQNLNTIAVQSGNTKFAVKDNVLFNSSFTRLLCYPIAKSGTSYVVPGTVTVIGGSAFFRCGNLKSIALPASLTTLESWSFAWCGGLTSVTLTEKLKSVGEGAFYGCSGLSTVTIPYSITNIGNDAFKKCDKISRVNYTGTATQWQTFAASGLGDGNDALTGIYFTDVAITSNLPASCRVYNGSGIKLGIQARGSGLGYQWYYRKKGASGWSKWSSQTAASLSATANDSWNGMQVYCAVKASGGQSVNSNICTIKVYQTLSVTTQPKSVTVTDGANVTFKVVASGTELSYQWYYRKKGVSDWSKWNGHTSASTSATANTTWNGMQLYCLIKDGNGGSVKSSVATITISNSAGITITSQPANISVQAGSNVTFSVKATGRELTYQWYYKKKGASAWSKWNGRTKASTTATSNATWNGMRVRCLVSDSMGQSVYSESALVSVTQSLKITGQPKNVTVKNGGTASFSVKAEGIDLSYQWYYRKKGVTSWLKWNGHTTASTSATANASWHGMQVYCIVKDVTGKTVSSSAATVSVTQKITVSLQPENLTVYPDDIAYFSVNADGIELSYQWYYKKKGAADWSKWNGHTDWYTKAVANSSWNGMQVYCVISDYSGQKVSSDTATVTILSRATKVKTVGVDVAVHTQNDIWNYVRQKEIAIGGTDTYATAPVLSGSYSAGTLSQSTLNNSLNVLNTIRYIAGLPDNVKLNDTCNKYCQAGALVNYVNGTLSHYPSQPDGMSKELFDLGYRGCCNSNIAMTSWKSSLSYSMIYQWLYDSDMNNIYALGHRRWILNPRMGITGFGSVYGEKGTYTQMYSLDYSGSSDISTVVWPASQTPVEFFPRGSAWNISSSVKFADDVSVKMVRIRDGKSTSWVCSKDSQDCYFIKNSTNYGLPYCLIFGPYDLTCQDGDIFNIYVSENGSVTKTYSVTFFSLG